MLHLLPTGPEGAWRPDLSRVATPFHPMQAPFLLPSRRHPERLPPPPPTMPPPSCGDHRQKAAK